MTNKQRAEALYKVLEEVSAGTFRTDRGQRAIVLGKAVSLLRADEVAIGMAAYPIKALSTDHLSTYSYDQAQMNLVAAITQAVEHFDHTPDEEPQNEQPGNNPEVSEIGPCSYLARCSWGSRLQILGVLAAIVWAVYAAGRNDFISKLVDLVRSSATVPELPKEGEKK
jgi:hypothetical protein